MEFAHEVSQRRARRLREPFADRSDECRLIGRGRFGPPLGEHQAAEARADVILMTRLEVVELDAINTIETRPLKHSDTHGALFARYGGQAAMLIPTMHNL